jgi:aspartokinase/homoserine dehydrogenase 1
MSYGELMSSRILAASFAIDGISSKWIDARELILTNSNFGNATVDYDVTYSRITRRNERRKKLLVIPGFIASDKEKVTTTLGRGGSDYTAAIFAAGAGADSLEIWTDVSGMMTADPDGYLMQGLFPPFRIKKRWNSHILVPK